MMTDRFRQVIAGMLLATVVAAVGATGAAAQDLGTLQNRIDRLERSLNDLKIFVHRGKGTAAPATSSVPSGTNAAPAGGVDGKIAALEAEIRALTNRVEEINFTVRRMSDRMDKLVSDVDFRLTAIERNMAAGGGQPAPSGGDGSGRSTAATSPSGSGAARSLGTVSQQSVDRVPTAGTEAPSGQQVARAAVAAAPPEALQGTPKQRYEAAFDLLQSKRFGEAESAFGQLVQDHPKHELAGNAQYWLGETYYVQGDYERAAGAFLEGYKNYRSSSKSPDNLLKLGMTLAILKQTSDACAVFAELKDRFPNASGTINRRAKRERQKAGC